MANSKIKIYATKLTPARNALVDDIELYLSSLTPRYESDNFQYLKLSLDLNIKINTHQDAIAKYNIGNYVRIEQDEKVWYYFIMNSDWKSENTVELKLSIDSINTFRNDLHFSAKTRIMRQHMPRWIQLVKPSYELNPQRITNITFPQGEYYSDKVINFSSEGLEPLISTKQNSMTFRVYNKESQSLTFSFKCAKISFRERTIRIFDAADKLLSVYEYSSKTLWSIQLDQNTYITYSIRQDEIKALLSGLITYTPGRYMANIDKDSEDIVSAKYLAKREEITHINRDYNWYLMYRNREDISPTDAKNPVECFCFADVPLVIGKSGGKPTQTLTTSNIQPNKAYYVLKQENPDFKLTLNNAVIRNNKNDTTSKFNFFSVNLGSRIKYKSTEIGFGNIPNVTTEIIAYTGSFNFKADGSGKITGRIELMSQGDNTLPTVEVPGVSAPMSFKPYPTIDYLIFTCDSITINTFQKARLSDKDDINFDYANQIITDIQDFSVGVSVSLITSTINDIDKTDSRIVKIIKLPYAPESVEEVDGVINFSQSWIYDQGLMKLQDYALTTEFENKNFSNVNFDFLFKNISFGEKRNDSFETKIYNSNFTSYKFVYDNFIKEIKLENFYPTLPSKISYLNVPISFKPTNTINSKFAFYFNTNSNAGIDYHKESDFDDYMLASRNNEETIFSSAFIDYIRTGYNYDLKSRAISERQSWLGAGLQLATGIVSFAASAFTGGVSAAAGISLVSGAISSFSSAISSREQAENSMAAKLDQLRAQSVSVSGTDDMDLFSYYSNNKLLYLTYETTPEQKQYLLDLFYYCGYAHNRMEIPNTTSRLWFNFIQCKPVFNEEGITPFNDYLDDVKARYEAGVTVYHSVSGAYDWSQEKENSEIF